MNKDSITTQQKKAKLLKALGKTLGLIAPACRMTRVNRQTFYNWLKSDLQFKDDYQNIIEDSLDFAEATLFQLISEGNAKATIFFLSHKAKHRGWSLSASHNGNINSQKNIYDLENKSDEDLWEIINNNQKIFVQQ